MQPFPSGTEIVRFSHVSKQYPGVLANDDVSLSVEKGEVFALVGENGAGKSTLMNMLYGLTRPTLGEIWIKDEKTGAQHSPVEAMRMGVSMVHQHFKLVPSFTVAQNILLGHEPKKNGLFYDAEGADRAVPGAFGNLWPAGGAEGCGRRAERRPAAACGNSEGAAHGRGGARAGRTDRRFDAAGDGRAVSCYPPHCQ